jgi:dynein heavy chain, axonemal
MTNSVRDINESVQIAKTLSIWSDYLEFVNDIVIDGISTAICTSLRKLNDFVDMETKKEKDYVPMFDIKIELTDSEIRFEPEIGILGDNKTVRNIIKLITDDFVHLGFLITRQDTGVGDYVVELKTNFEIRDNYGSLNSNLDLLEDKCHDYKNGFGHLSMLWTKDPKETFQEFLENEIEVAKPVIVDGEVVEVPDEQPDKKNPIMVGVTTKLPKFELFNERINELKKIKNEIDLIKTSQDIGWLRVNANPMRNSLKNRVDQWIKIYTNFFLNQSRTIIKNCHNFKEYLINGTSKDPSLHPEDKALLMNTMEVLSKHRLVQNRINHNVEFLKKMIDILKVQEVDTNGEDFMADID